jgi:hypothetical protein
MAKTLAVKIRKRQLKMSVATAQKSLKNGQTSRRQCFVLWVASRFAPLARGKQERYATTGRLPGPR